MFVAVDTSPSKIVRFFKENLTLNGTFTFSTGETPIISMAVDKYGAACVVTGINIVRVNLTTLKRLSKYY